MTENTGEFDGSRVERFIGWQNCLLIAGTNRDLSRMVRDGKFREDLLAHINLWTFRLPGLRDRAEDIEPNLDYECDAGEITRLLAI